MATVDQTISYNKDRNGKSVCVASNAATQLKREKDTLADSFHLVPVHEHHRSELVSTSSYSNICSQTGVEVRNKTVLSSRLWSEDSSYPGIPFQVACFLCETSPDLLQQMEATLHCTNGTPNRGASSCVSSIPVASPLLHMCAVTDALALQESVIGQSTKCAPPDVVAQVVASVQNHWCPANLSQDSFIGSASRIGPGPRENCLNLNTEPLKDGSNEAITALVSKFNIEAGEDLGQSKLKLHRFPKDRITTTVEKQNWLSGTAVKELVSHADASYFYPNIISSQINQFCSPLPCEADSGSVLSVNTTKLLEESFDTPAVSEMNSVSSEKCEIESNFSEHFEVQSNISEVSGLENEEMFHMKKPLIDSSSAQDTLNDVKILDMQSYLDVVREKAVIEGQMEVLSLEVENAVRDRIQLHNQLSAAKSLTNSQKTLMKATDQEIETLRIQINELNSKLNESEDLIVGLRGVLDAKVEEAAQSREDAVIYEADAQQCRIALQEMKVDVESKDGAIRGLKNKVAELHVELQNLLQGKKRTESDLHTRLNQLTSEEKMKEWYRQQFQDSQVAKGKVQQELITLQTAVANHESLVEKLRFERDHSRQQLAELQERAVREKEGLLRHLENIEADMRERESIFLQLQRDQGSVEESVLLQIKRVEEERAKLAQETFARGEMEHQFVAIKSEAEAKAIVVEKLEKEVAQLLKQLTILQKTMSEKELEIHALGEWHVEQERQSKELQLHLQTQEKHLETMKQEKTAMEVELKAARRERSNMDATLVDVRNNVLKLDSRLKQMREELNVKMSFIEKLKQEKMTLEDEVKAKDVVVEQHKRRLAKAEDEVHKLKENLSNMYLAKEEADQVKVLLYNELSSANARLERVSANCECTVAENAGLKEKIKILENFSVTCSTREDLITKLNKELSQTKLKLSSKENLICKPLNEKQDLQKSTMLTGYLSKNRDDGISDVEHQEMSPETPPIFCEDQLMDDRKIWQKTVPESKPSGPNLAQLQEESSAVHAFLVQTECRTKILSSMNDHLDHHHLVKNVTQNINDIESNHSEIKEQCRRYESNIRVLTRKLQMSSKVNKSLKAEIKVLEEKLAEKVKAHHSANTGQAPLNQSLNDNNSGKGNDGKMIYYRKKIKIMENKLTEMQKFCEEEKRRADHNQTLLIDLEKQRGKLHAIAEHRTALQQHTSELEAALSEKEIEINELDLQAKDTQARKLREEMQLRESLTELQQKFTSEQVTNRDLRKQVFKEKCETSQLRKHAACLKSSLEEVSRMLDMKRSEITNVESELEMQRTFVHSLRAEVGALEMKLVKSHEEINGLKKEVEQNQAKDPLLADQIKTLGWHLHQKNQVIVALKEQSKQKEMQSVHEVERIENALKITKCELEAVKYELEATMKEKFDYQNQVTELRSALKLSLGRNKALQKEYTKHFSAGDTAMKSDLKLLEAKLFESPAPYDESLIAALLQKSLTIPESRPLSNLQVCLNTLKQEMAILQQQLLNETHGTN